MALAVLHRQVMANSKVKVDRSVHCTFVFMAAPVITKRYTRHVTVGFYSLVSALVVSKEKNKKLHYFSFVVSSLKCSAKPLQLYDSKER